MQTWQCVIKIIIYKVEDQIKSNQIILTGISSVQEAFLILKLLTSLIVSSNETS